MNLETFVRQQFEPLQYLAFFGALAVLAMVEALVPARRMRIERLRRWPANYALTFINIALISALPVSGLVVADWAQAHGFGLMPALGVPATAAVVCGFLLRSLGNYAVHVAMHKIPLLWRLHRVHHSNF